MVVIYSHYKARRGYHWDLAAVSRQPEQGYASPVRSSWWMIYLRGNGKEFTGNEETAMVMVKGKSEYSDPSRRHDRRYRQSVDSAP
jgi:hypothetical protein